MLRSMDNAYRLLSSKEREAFDITLEPEESRKKYDTGRFGRGCLLARRLIEAGTRFVEVTTEYVPFLHWDTHKDGHETLDKLHQEIDLPIATLVTDLEKRGLLERTLIIVASEFSRDALIEGRPGSKAADQATFKVEKIEETKHYGLHRHFTGGTNVLMFGGGMKRGHLRKAGLHRFAGAGVPFAERAGRSAALCRAPQPRLSARLPDIDDPAQLVGPVLAVSAAQTLVPWRAVSAVVQRAACLGCHPASQVLHAACRPYPR
jgi:hypothetical protein